MRKIKQEMKAAGALGAMMSGSGPTVFGLFESRAAATGRPEKHQRKGTDQTGLCDEYTQCEEESGCRLILKLR